MAAQLALRAIEAGRIGRRYPESASAASAGQRIAALPLWDSAALRALPIGCKRSRWHEGDCRARRGRRL
jgi:hypothetical protein